MTLPQFVEQYGYIAVFVGCFLEGETMLVLAGLAAHLGYLSLPWVMGIAAVAGFMGDETWFFTGRYFGPRLLAWSPRLRAAQPVVLKRLEKHAIWVVFLIRFAVGLRTASPVIIGASGLAPLRFTPPNAAGAIVWAVTIGGAGYLFGSAFAGFIEHAKQYEGWAFAALATVAVGIWAVGRIRTQRKLRDLPRDTPDR